MNQRMIRSVPRLIWPVAMVLMIVAALFSSKGGQAEEEDLRLSPRLAQANLPGVGEEQLISLDFRGAPIQTVLEALAKKAGLNIVTTQDVAGEVSIHLENVTWESALDTIVQTAGLVYEKKDNVVIVSTIGELKARREAVQEIAQMESVITKVIQLKYLDAADVKKFLEPQLSPQGKISVLEITGQKGWKFMTTKAGGGGGTEERTREEREKARSKAVVITDTPTVIDRLEKVLARVDVLPRQILIETRVMEVSRDLLRDLGVELGTGTNSTTLSSSSGFDQTTQSRTFSQQSLSKRRGERDLASFGGSVLNQFLDPSIFNPEATGLSSANTGLSLVLRKLRGTQLEMLIRALEEDNRTNTLSAPHVLTLSGQEARILIGEKFPILETQVSGTTSTTTTTTLDYYQDIGIELFVVPQVAGDRHIDMIIHPVISARTGSVGTNQYPILDVREAETQVVVEDGETVVIGGLLKDVKARSRVGLPFLGHLPFLGVLFSRSTQDVEKIDLLIFITARVVQPGGLSAEEMERLRQKYEQFFHESVSKSDKRGSSFHQRTPAATANPTRSTPGKNRGFLYRKE